MTDKEWYEMLRNQAEAAEKEYNDAVDVLTKENPPYSDEMILSYLIAKEKYRITGLRMDCANAGHKLSDFIH